MGKADDSHAGGAPPDRPSRGPLRPALIHRLTHYLDFIEAYVNLERGPEVSSALLGEFSGVDAGLVRRDLAAIGLRGCPRKGFPCAEALRAIRAVLGLETPRRGVMLGAGNLGRALALYPGDRKSVV
jgi:redox-sensing transcriptional repressor